MEKFMTQQRAGEFVHAQNFSFDPKTNQEVPKKNQKFALL
jgi:hypothetical protein